MPKGYFTPFTEAQKTQIKEEYLTKPLNQLGREVNAKSARIKRFLKQNGLEVPKSLLQKRIQESYKKKGHQPFNKGLKQEEYMSAEAIAKTAKTRFKKGNNPHNTLKIHTERVTKDGYIEVKIASPNVWKLKQRLVYEKHYKTQLQKGEVVIFIDKNTRNFSPNNLKKISKAENMLRNSKGDFPQEIIPTMALISQINNKIKTLENGTK